MKRFLPALLLVAVSQVAVAQDVSLSMLCRILPAYQKLAGVDYQPGVDVHGKPVVPADLDAPLQAGMGPVEIPIEIDLAQRFQLHLPAGAELKPSVAALTIYPDGYVEYNGRNVSAQAQALCQSTPEAPVKTDGQGASEPVKLGSPIDGKYP